MHTIEDIRQKKKANLPIYFVIWNFKYKNDQHSNLSMSLTKDVDKPRFPLLLVNIKYINSSLI